MDLVERLWRAGIAHRDLKPANMLVREGHLQLVDVSGLQVRPSPWREAVDLANMMLTLALRTDPDRVYERAIRRFTPDDVAEAFAAARGLAIPTQVSEKLKRTHVRSWIGSASSHPFERRSRSRCGASAESRSPRSRSSA